MAPSSEASGWDGWQSPWSHPKIHIQCREESWPWHLPWLNFKPRNLGSKMVKVTSFPESKKKPVFFCEQKNGCPMVPYRLLWGWIQTYEWHIGIHAIFRRNIQHHPALQLSSPKKSQRPRQIGCQITFHVNSALFRVKLLMYCRVFTLGQTNNS